MSLDLKIALPVLFRTALHAFTFYEKGDYKKNTEAAQRYLKNDKTSPFGLYFSLVQLFHANSFLVWEPESIWFELLREHQIDLPLVNRDKVSALITAIHNDAFHWDALIFENSAKAFNDEISTPDTVQEASPAELSWAVFLFEILARHTGRENPYDYEPTKYAALSMHRGGLLLAPELLVFAQEELDKFNQQGKTVAQAVSDTWATVNKEKLEELSLAETAVDIQLGKLAAIHLYVGSQAEALHREIAALT